MIVLQLWNELVDEGVFTVFEKGTKIINKSLKYVLDNLGLHLRGELPVKIVFFDYVFEVFLNESYKLSWMLWKRLFGKGLG